MEQSVEETRPGGVVDCAGEIPANHLLDAEIFYNDRSVFLLLRDFRDSRQIIVDALFREIHSGNQKPTFSWFFFQ